MHECSNIIINSFHFFFTFSLYVYMFFVYLIFLKKILIAATKFNNILILNLTHSLVNLTFKFWYQLLTMTLSIVRKLEIINTLFMWKQKIMLKLKAETNKFQNPQKTKGSFDQTFCGMGRIPNGFYPFFPIENVFPNPFINI